MDAPIPLATAPVIGDWYRLPTADGGWCVSGIFENHPDHHETFVGQTEPLVAEGDGWCQTERRVYSLGRPREPAPEPEEAWSPSP